MQHISARRKNETSKNVNIFQHKGFFISLVPVAALVLLCMVPPHSFGAQGKAKLYPTKVQKGIVINDANLQAYQKRVEDFVKKGDFENSLKIMLNIHDYTKEVLSVVKVIKTQYEKAVNDPSIPQNDKEEFFIKLKGLDQLIPRYTTLYEASTFDLGYIYAKRGETEKARGHLIEFLQMTPFSSSQDSQWMKAKTLLLELYSLEGEF